MKTDLTPDNLIEQARSVERGFSAYKGDEFTASALRYLAEILRGSEPVAEIIADKTGDFNGQIFSDRQWIDLVNLPVGTKLYPQPVKKCEWVILPSTLYKLSCSPREVEWRHGWKFCPYCGGEIVEEK